MENLSVDLLTNILFTVSDEEIEILKENDEVKEIIENVLANNIFWKKRTDHLLQYETDETNDDWKSHYLRLKKMFDNNDYSDLFKDEFQNSNIFLLDLVLESPLFTNQLPFDYELSLYDAINKGNYMIVYLLLSHFDVQTYETDLNPLSGWPLSVPIQFKQIIQGVCKNGYSEMLKMLLKYRELPTKLSIYDSTCINQAAENGNFKIVKVLLSIAEKYGKDFPSNQNNYPLRIAAKRGYDKTLKLLLAFDKSQSDKSHSDKSQSDKSPDYLNYAIRKSCKHGHFKVVKLLLDDGRVNAAVDNNYPLRIVSSNGYKNILALLLKQKSVIDSSGPRAYFNAAIGNAAANGHYDVVDLLLRTRNMPEYNQRIGKDGSFGYADPSAGNNYAIRLAAANGHRTIVRLLLKDDRVNPVDEDNSVFKLAVNNGRHRIVELLLNDKRVNSKIENKMLKIAAKKGHYEIVRMLLKFGLTDSNDSMAIILASENGYDDIVELLLEHGSNPSALDNIAIQTASQNGHYEVVKILLESGLVDPTVCDNFSLRIARGKERNDIVELLLPYCQN